ncbi:MAG TPA: DUF6428 family protein [Flavobacterium sp.]|jgi:hypothetical protein
MKLSQVKEHLKSAESVNFKLESGIYVPEHFHITEVGVVTKHFIDCGGKVRHERVANFQLWDANDFEHRLKPQKLLNIIALSQKVLAIEDLEVEVEYQSDTVGKYDLDFDGHDFILQSKKTACLAKDRCRPKASTAETACCSTESKCC